MTAAPRQLTNAERKIRDSIDARAAALFDTPEEAAADRRGREEMVQRVLARQADADEILANVPAVQTLRAMQTTPQAASQRETTMAPMAARVQQATTAFAAVRAARPDWTEERTRNAITEAGWR